MKQPIYMQIKTNQSNSHKTQSSQSKNSVHTQKGYSEVAIAF